MQKQQVIVYTRVSMPPVSKEIEQSLLRGSITCGYCGCSLILSGTDYRCRERSNETCCGVTIAIDTIDTAVWNEVLKQLRESAITLFGSDEPTREANRQVLKMLGVTVILYKENDMVHNRYEIKQLATL